MTGNGNETVFVRCSLFEGVPGTVVMVMYDDQKNLIGHNRPPKILEYGRFLTEIRASADEIEEKIHRYVEENFSHPCDVLDSRILGGA